MMWFPHRVLNFVEQIDGVWQTETIRDPNVIAAYIKKKKEEELENMDLDQIQPTGDPVKDAVIKAKCVPHIRIFFQPPLGANAKYYPLGYWNIMRSCRRTKTAACSARMPPLSKKVALLSCLTVLSKPTLLYALLSFFGPNNPVYTNIVDFSSVAAVIAVKWAT